MAFARYPSDASKLRGLCEPERHRCPIRRMHDLLDGWPAGRRLTGI